MKRRDFVRTGTAAALGIGVLGDPRILQGSLTPMGVRELYQEADRRRLAMLALDAAQSAGAGYADVRINANRTQGIFTREDRVQGLVDNETYGFGVRVLVEGTWGFAASMNVSESEMARVAQEAVAQAKANRVAQRRPVELAHTEVYPDAKWQSPIEIDPFDISIEEKAELLLAANAAALGVSGARFCNSSLFFLREDKFFASSLGTVSDQRIYRAGPSLTVTAVASDQSDFQSRQANEMAPIALGWEYVLQQDMVGNAPMWAEEAVEKLSAKPVQPGRYDLILMPDHLWLTIHESIAHPTELDRIMGFEANYAGTSFISSPEEYLGKFRYGPEFMNVQGERSTPGGLSTVGYDDEGVKPDDYLIVKDGVLNDLQTTREQAPMLSDWYRSQGLPIRSHGNSYAQSWADVQFQRMPNINLLPHPDRDVSLDELVSDVEDGIIISGDGSFSIDQQRFNAQFGGQTFREIKNGRVGGMLKDVAYQIRTPEFWSAMDLLGGESTYFMGGAFGDGKGQPAQSNSVSHGCPVTRHRQINVINTGRRA